jgi:hypothetical protein
LALELLHSIWVLELNVEILIWLPVVIISNLHRDELNGLSSLELKGLLDLLVIVSGLGLSINGANSDRASNSLLIMNMDLDSSGSLRH